MSPITEGALYNEAARNAGEVAEHDPAEYIDSRIAEGAVPFGVIIAEGAAPRGAKVISSGSDKVLGLAGFSFEASDLDDEQYADGDSVAAIRRGVAVAVVEEAVVPGNDVRVRIAEDPSAGYQEWGFSTIKVASDTSGLANDTTKYGAIVTVDGVAKEINITGSAAQTFGGVITGINTDLGTAGVAALVGGKIRITSATTGAKSRVSITDGNDSADAGLFASLTGANEAAEEAVDGSDDVSAVLEPGRLRTSAITGKTAKITGIEFRGETDGAGLVPVWLSGNYTLTAD